MEERLLHNAALKNHVGTSYKGYALINGIKPSALSDLFQGRSMKDILFIFCYKFSLHNAVMR